MVREDEVAPPEDPIEAFVKRAAAGSRQAGNHLGKALVDNPDLVLRVLDYLRDPRHLVRQGAAEAILALASEHGEDVLDHVAIVHGALDVDDAPFRATLLGILAELARVDASSVEPVVEQLEAQLGRPQQFVATGYAALALGRYAASAPDRADAVLPHLANALARKPKEALAKEVLQAYGEFVQGVGLEGHREDVRDAVKPMMGHPSALVRERAHKLLSGL